MKNNIFYNKKTLSTDTQRTCPKDFRKNPSRGTSEGILFSSAADQSCTPPEKVSNFSEIFRITKGRPEKVEVQHKKNL